MVSHWVPWAQVTCAPRKREREITGYSLLYLGFFSIFALDGGDFDFPFL